jgi:hypothetical protein
MVQYSKPDFPSSSIHSSTLFLNYAWIVIAILAPSNVAVNQIASLPYMISMRYLDLLIIDFRENSVGFTLLKENM